MVKKKGLKTTKLIRRVYPKEPKGTHRQLRRAYRQLSHKERRAVNNALRVMWRREEWYISEAAQQQEALQANRLG